MTRIATWTAVCGMLLFGCSLEAQDRPVDGWIWTGHQPAHPMRHADGSIRTLPNGEAIQLAGGTFTIALRPDGVVEVDRVLDDGRSFHYAGQCAKDAESWRCSASDGVGVPLNFYVILPEGGGPPAYQSRGGDPGFVLTPAAGSPPSN